MVKRFIFVMVMGAMAFSACGGSGTCSPPSLSGGAGITACSTAKAYVSCADANGTCTCLSNDPSTCPACGSTAGLTCQNLCAADEYDISCGGLPGGGPYQSVPSNCHAAGTTPGGNTFACCPCG